MKEDCKQVLMLQVLSILKKTFLYLDQACVDIIVYCQPVQLAFPDNIQARRANGVAQPKKSANLPVI